jgi:hypothetical protein
MNNKRIAAYHKAYKNYTEANQKYHKLVRAHDILKDMASHCDSFPNTKKIIRKVGEEVRREKAVITGLARECSMHLQAIDCQV